jgi:flagellar capping protein FliD
VGILLKDTGKLELDEEKFTAAFTAHPDDVKKLFTQQDSGLSDRLHAAAESLVGKDKSLLINRAAALQAKIEANNKRIDFYNDHLEARRQRLLNQFNQMESIIARLQNDLTSISALQALTPAN